DIADDLALAHMAADTQAIGITRHVAIGGFVAVDVADLDLVAVAGLPFVILDDAIAGGIDRGAAGGGQIGAGMQAPRLEDGVDAVAEPRAQRATAFQRATVEEALAGFAIGVIKIYHAVIGAEAIELAGGAAQYQADIEQVGAALGIGRGFQNFDGIAGR